MSALGKSDIVIIAPLGEPIKRVRLAKTIKLLHQDYGLLLEFWGWNRKKINVIDQRSHGIIKTRYLLSGGGFDNKYARVLYLPFMFMVFVSALFHAPRKVYCLGLETALPLWFASRLRKRITYIFDDADRLVLISSYPKWIERIIIHFEKKVSRDSAAHIVPSLQRYNYETDKQIELNNFPASQQIIAAKKVSGNKNNLKFAVYVNGWLGPTRGLKLLDETAEILEGIADSQIIFNVAAGNITGPLSNFFNRKNVNYMGSLTQVEALSKYPENDIVVTFYDPSIAINTYAIPNKWGDAVAMNCPILLNDGIKTAKHLLEAGAAISVPFDDPQALCDLLISLKNDEDKLRDMKKAIKKVAPNYKPFDEAMKPILERFI